mgnify:CR=1 FL=1
MNNKNKETFTRSDIESSLKKKFPNLTKQEITTILTRFGERSKYIDVGDSNQSDINGKSGFSPIIKASAMPFGFFC